MIKIMFLAIFAALVTLHADVNGGLVKPEEAYNCYWAIANASDRVCRNHEQDGFFFFNFPTCAARCRSGNIERRLPPGITCDEHSYGRPGYLECLGEIGQNDEPLLCLGCTADVLNKLSRWQSG
uniref:Putative wc protein n=1 Tax=Ixodes ricinus TaxID=34613 RepID=A0A0K8RI73_IXORI